MRVVLVLYRLCLDQRGIENDFPTPKPFWGFNCFPILYLEKIKDFHIFFLQEEREEERDASYNSQ